MVEEEAAVAVEERASPAQDMGLGMARGVVQATVVMEEVMVVEAAVAVAKAEVEGLAARVPGTGRGVAPDMDPGVG